MLGKLKNELQVHVIEVMQKTMEESWASYEKPQSGFEQGLLQVADNTLIIIDETKLSPESLLLTKKGIFFTKLLGLYTCFNRILPISHALHRTN